ncbi:MAG: Y-family DNA polymerase [Spirochaetes bacterium]|nr:Y-family DNA polymerase [Spirochaetota bacterium]
MTMWYALVDCNNFYASCEKVCNPALAKRPVVVLSNNDGNVIARCPLAKALGIEMGAPFHQCKDIINRHHVAVFSSNYALYADMSRRVMDTLATCAPYVEVYSIDEAFLLCDVPPAEAQHYALSVREKVMQWTGIPVSVGMGATKTLAKLANHIAKKRTDSGVFVLAGDSYCQSLLETIDIAEVWGIGRRYARMLQSYGIGNVWQLINADDSFIKKKMTVVGLRTVYELRGIPCIGWEDAPPPKKAIVSSRSFGRPVESLHELDQAAAHYSAIAAGKLRRQHCAAGAVTVFVSTNPFKNEPQYSCSATVVLDMHSAYTPDIIAAARTALCSIYREGYRYKKVGIMLTDIIACQELSPTLFTHMYNYEKRYRLMQALDSVNCRHGRGAVYFASEGVIRPWSMRRKYLSPRYTTHWDEIPVVT